MCLFNNCRNCCNFPTCCPSPCCPPQPHCCCKIVNFKCCCCTVTGEIRCTACIRPMAQPCRRVCGRVVVCGEQGGSDLMTPGFFR